MIFRFKNINILEKNNFLNSLKNNIVGKRYDYQRIIHFFINSKVLTKIKKNSIYSYKETDDKVICSHHIYKHLYNNFDDFRKTIDNYKASLIKNEQY